MEQKAKMRTPIVSLKASPNPESKDIFLHLEDNDIHAALNIDYLNREDLKKDLNECIQALVYLEESDYFDN